MRVQAIKHRVSALSALFYVMWIVALQQVWSNHVLIGKSGQCGRTMSPEPIRTMSSSKVRPMSSSQFEPCPISRSKLSALQKLSETAPAVLNYHLLDRLQK